VVAGTGVVVGTGLVAGTEEDCPPSWSGVCPGPGELLWFGSVVT
jgi:hypothetical protein